MANQKSAKHYVLTALVPYTKANLQLTFKPSLFFAELEKLDRIKQNTSRNAYHRAVKKKLIELDSKGIPRLTKGGLELIKPYTSEKLPNSKLMIIFDIPEDERWKRRHLRALLRELQFKQAQKSVWVSEYDHREYLKSEVKNLSLQDNVKIFECLELN